jgi:Putative prokaryotic signal transducing protein
MAELVRTNDLALISAVEGLLTEAGIPYHVADRHQAVLEGLVNWLQMRILVPDEREAEARELLTDAELGEWLRS